MYVKMHRKCECLNTQMSTVVISEWCDYRRVLFCSLYFSAFTEHVFMHNKILSKRY